MRIRHLGYAAHSIAYFTLTLTVLSCLRPERGEHDVAIVSGLLLHGIATETSQVLIPGRSWDVFDLSCNLTATLAAGVVFYSISRWLLLR
ncbi:MAG: VanZ family protein, partial [Planctomycetaceae bacterium]|nr:VanZ family protein [Planctomycetaceae bacterium]